MIHNCTKELQQADLKATPARLAMLKLFESHDKPLDAQHLTSHLQKSLNLDRVTVFRILNAFTKNNLINKLEFGEGKARYELNKNEHHHLICQNCGAIEDISDCGIEELEAKIKKKKNFLVKHHSLEFYGLCNNCQK